MKRREMQGCRLKVAVDDGLLCTHHPAFLEPVEPSVDLSASTGSSGTNRRRFFSGR
ncbi:MAG TPA: hypothetical protein VGH34_11115 [Vicinamibacterales bacterium]